MLPTDVGECQVPVEHGERHTDADAGSSTSAGVFPSPVNASPFIPPPQSLIRHDSAAVAPLPEQYLMSVTD